MYRDVVLQLQQEDLEQRSVKNARLVQSVSKRESLSSCLVSAEVTLGEAWLLAKAYIPEVSMWSYFASVDGCQIDMDPNFEPPVELSYDLRLALYCITEGISIGKKLAKAGSQAIGPSEDVPTFNMLLNMARALDLAGHVASIGQNVWEAQEGSDDEFYPFLQRVYECHIEKSSDVVCAPSPLSAAQSGDCMTYLRQYRQSEFYDYCPDAPKPSWW